MQEPDRYSMPVDNMHQDEIDLLECLLRIDMREPLDPRAGGMCSRMIEAGLVDETERGLRLTAAGIQRTQSLQHRLAGDREAAKVLATRGIALASSPQRDRDLDNA